MVGQILHGDVRFDGTPDGSKSPMFRFGGNVDCGRIIERIGEQVDARSIVLATVEQDGHLLPLYPPHAHLEAEHRSLIDEGRYVAAELDGVSTIWRTCRSGENALFMLLEPAPGKASYVLGFGFGALSPVQRARADDVCRTVRGLLSAYVNLWSNWQPHLDAVAAMEAMLNLTGMGTLLLRSSGQIVFANTAAEQLIRRGHGITRRADGVLRAIDISDEINLQAALSHVDAEASDEAGCQAACGRSIAPLLSFRRRAAPALVAAILRAPVASSMGSSLAVMFVVDPILDPKSVLTPLCRLHGLSPVESALVCNLVAGETVTSAAEKMRIKAQTARSYLKQIFVKTGTRRQAELAVFMLSSLIRTPSETVQQALTSQESERAIAGMGYAPSA